MEWGNFYWSFLKGFCLFSLHNYTKHYLRSLNGLTLQDILLVWLTWTMRVLLSGILGTSWLLMLPPTGNLDNLMARTKKTVLVWGMVRCGMYPATKHWDLFVRKGYQVHEFVTQFVNILLLSFTSQLLPQQRKAPQMPHQVLAIPPLHKNRQSQNILLLLIYCNCIIVQ